MKFGIFDHIDDSGIARAEQLEERLRLVEQYDGDGFHAYHVAEHHGTPLGIVGSPNVFLAAVATAALFASEVMPAFTTVGSEVPR